MKSYSGFCRGHCECPVVENGFCEVVLKKRDVFVSVGNEFGRAQTLHSMALIVGRGSQFSVETAFNLPCTRVHGPQPETWAGVSTQTLGSFFSSSLHHGAPANSPVTRAV